MRNKSIIAVLALLTLGLTHAATPSPVYACSCIGQRTAKQVMEVSDVVFLGTVISITEATPVSPGNSMPFTEIEVLFQVITQYKGEQKAQHVVHTGKGGGDCGVSFTVGETTVVFASGMDNQSLSTGLCSYLRPYGALPDEIALGAGSPPPGEIALGAGSLPSEQQDSSISYIVPVIALVVLASVVAFIIKRRRKAVAL